MSVTFRHRPYSSVKDILLKPDGSFVKLWGWVDKIEAPYKVKNIRGERVSTSKATIRDFQGNYIGTTRLSERKYQQLSEMHERAEAVEIFGKTEPKKIGSGKWRSIINVISIASGASPLSRTQPSSRELKSVDDYIASRRNSGPLLFKELKASVCEHTATVLTDQNSDIIDFIILQSVSGGFLSETNGKLHSCVIGPPGVGKGKLVEIIKELNPIFEETQVERVTDVGLTGLMSRKGGIGVVEPRKLPKANLGIHVIQDFDKSRDKSSIYNVFSNVMQEGKVIVTGATEGTLDAAAAIHIDLNRQSHLYAGKVIKNFRDDIDMPSNIVSRFDYITEIEEDIEDQSKRGIEIIKISSRSGKRCRSSIAKYCRKHDDIEIDRFSKILTAYITTQYEHIDVTPVSKRIYREYKRLLKDYSDIPDLKINSGRLATSIQKFVVAASRIQLRKRANKRAVKMAVQMVKRKLNFLRESQSTPNTTAAPANGKQAFEIWITDEYGTDFFEPSKVIKHYRKQGNPCGDVSDSTLWNWIRDAADKDKHKRWTIKEEIMQQYQ